MGAKTAAFILKFSGIPHGFVTNKSSLSHRYCAIYWFVSIRVMWWSYDVWSRSSVFIHMIRYWPDVWLNSWSVSDRICAFAYDLWVSSSFDLFFLLQCSFQPPARCTVTTGAWLGFCTASSCSRSERDCYTGDVINIFASVKIWLWLWPCSELLAFLSAKLLNNFLYLCWCVVVFNILACGKLWRC